jgi:hypothetical protein
MFPKFLGFGASLGPSLGPSTASDVIGLEFDAAA